MVIQYWFKLRGYSRPHCREVHRSVVNAGQDGNPEPQVFKLHSMQSLVGDFEVFHLLLYYLGQRCQRSVVYLAAVWTAVAYLS